MAKHSLEHSDKPSCVFYSSAFPIGEYRVKQLWLLIIVFSFVFYFNPFTGFIYIFLCLQLNWPLQKISEMEAAVSNDGSKLAFRGVVNGNSDIYISNLDGTNPKRITHWDSNEGGPSWSPSGEKISFFSNKSGNFEVYVFDLKSESIKRVSYDSGLNLASFWLDAEDTLFYTSDTNEEVRFYNLKTNDDGHWSSLYEHHSIITQSKVSKTLWGVMKIEKDWELAKIPRDGKNPEIVASHPSRDSEPSESPDGLSVVFASKRTNDGWQIFHMKSDGTNIEQLTTVGRNNGPSWLDNERIIFSSSRNGETHLFELNLKEGTEQKFNIDW